MFIDIKEYINDEKVLNIISDILDCDRALMNKETDVYIELENCGGGKVGAGIGSLIIQQWRESLLDELVDLGYVYEDINQKGFHDVSEFYKE